MTTTTHCPACAQPFRGHPWCVRCRCFHHAPARYDAQLCRECDARLAKAGLRRCTACGEVKPRAKFAKDGRRVCTQCRNKQHDGVRTRWRAKHAAAINARQRARYASDPQRYRDSALKSYRKHRPARIAAALRWRAANRERHRATAQAYHAKHRIQRNAAARAWRQAQKLRAWFGGR